MGPLGCEDVKIAGSGNRRRIADSCFLRKTFENEDTESTLYTYIRPPSAREDDFEWTHLECIHCSCYCYDIGCVGWKMELFFGECASVCLESISIYDRQCQIGTNKVEEA